MVPMLDEAIEETARRGAGPRGDRGAWRTAAGSMCWRTPWAARASRSSWSSRASRAWPPTPPRRRAAPATWCTTAPRAHTRPARGRPTSVEKLSPTRATWKYVNPVIEGRARAGPERAQGRPQQPRPRSRPPRADPRRRRLPRAGHRGRDPQPPVARRLHHRRHAPPDRQQPGSASPPIRRVAPPATPPTWPRASATCRSSMNADDVEACISAVRLAMAFRQTFNRDALIDVIGYRRFGHNETDEPAYTQPLMYERIKEHPPVRKLADRLAARVVSRTTRSGWRATPTGASRRRTPSWKESLGAPPDTASELDRTMSPEPKTTVQEDLLRGRGTSSCCGSPRASRSTASWRAVPRAAACCWSPASGILDWAHAEALAFASLLALRVPVRLTGQDTERGTFSQRHDALRREDGRPPLRDGAPAQRARQSSSTTARSRSRPASASSTATASRRSTRWWSGRPSSATS